MIKLRKIRLLVVDDSRISHAMIEGVLARTNFEICGSAKNCAEAVELYKELKPDAVTMDMNLPDADGLECSRRILEINSKAKIIMISAMRDAKLMMRGRTVGISSFLQKPLNATELIDTLKIACGFTDGDMSILQETYVKPFVKVLQQNLFSLAGVHSKVSVEQDTSSRILADGIAIIIGITGKPIGRMILHSDFDTMYNFAQMVLGEVENVTEEEANDSMEELANIIAGRSVSIINDICKDKEIRITPPGTICGNNLGIVNPNLTSFNVEAVTRLGVFKMNIGFAGGE